MISTATGAKTCTKINPCYCAGLTLDTLSMGIIGIIVFAGICWLFSTARRGVSLYVLGWGLALQFVLAFLVLGIPAWNVPGVLQPLFAALASGVTALLGFSMEGIRFLFGDLADAKKSSFILVIQVLMVIPFFSSLMAVLNHWGILQRIVYYLGKLMQKTMRVSGAESLAVAANVFLGQTEAPFVIRPYLASLTRSELLCLMVGGLATVAGTILAAYVGLLQNAVPDVAEHLITASVMSAPAALLAAKLLIPETEAPQTTGVVEVATPTDNCNAIDAAATGAKEGLYLAFNVSAMLLAFIGLVALINALLSTAGGWVSFDSWGKALVPAGEEVKLSLQIIFGWLCAPCAWLMGVPWSEALTAGALLGEKIVLNEFIAYLSLAQMGDTLSPRTSIIMSYALCGFANFSSIGILIGGLSSLVPERQHDVARLGMRALLGGTIAAMITAAIAGLFI